MGFAPQSKSGNWKLTSEESAHFVDCYAKLYFVTTIGGDVYDEKQQNRFTKSQIGSQSFNDCKLPNLLDLSFVEEIDDLDAWRGRASTTVSSQCSNSRTAVNDYVSSPVSAGAQTLQRFQTRAPQVHYPCFNAFKGSVFEPRAPPGVSVWDVDYLCDCTGYDDVIYGGTVVSSGSPVSGSSWGNSNQETVLTTSRDCTIEDENYYSVLSHLLDSDVHLSVKRDEDTSHEIQGLIESDEGRGPGNVANSE